MPNQHVIAAVIKRGEKLLICLRPQHKRHGGLWEFPGGKLEPGESLHDAARRELAEELGLEVKDVGAVAFTTVDEASAFTINFVEVAVAGDPHLLEHTAMQWLLPHELLALDLAPSDRRFAEFLNSEYRRS